MKRKMCYFNPLSLWSFVSVVMENEHNHHLKLLHVVVMNHPSCPKSFPCFKIANILNQKLSQWSQICTWRFGLWLQGLIGFHEVSHQGDLVACSLSLSFRSLPGRLNTKQYYHTETLHCSLRCHRSGNVQLGQS